MEPGHDVVVGEIDLPELRRWLRHRDGGRRAGRAVPLEQPGEVDVDELVAVHREHIAVLLPERRREADRASAAEPLRLPRADDLDTEAAEAALELRFLPGRRS